MITGGGMGVSTNATVKPQTGYVAMGIGGFYYAEFDDFSISKGILHFAVGRCDMYFTLGNSFHFQHHDTYCLQTEHNHIWLVVDIMCSHVEILLQNLFVFLFLKQSKFYTCVAKS